MSRTRSRQAALQVLYQDDFNPQRSRDIDRQYLIDQLDDNDDLLVFAWALVDGVRIKRESIDQLISEASDRWELNRLTAIDRNIIRIAVLETQDETTPVPVAIDEAIKSAKKYGGKDSPSFVNGVLDFILTGKVKPLADTTEPVSESPQEKPSGLKRFIKPKE